MPDAQSAPSLVERARTYVGLKGLPTDAFNAVVALNLQVEIPAMWPRIKKARTYSEYMFEKFDRDRDMADAVLVETNKDKVKSFDAIVGKINLVIAGGVTTQSQAEAIDVLLDEMAMLIYGRPRSR